MSENLKRIKSIIGSDLQKSEIEYFDDIDLSHIKRDTLILVKSEKSTSFYLYFWRCSGCVVSNIGLFTKNKANLLTNPYKGLSVQIKTLFDFVEIRTIEKLRRLPSVKLPKKRISIFYNDNTGYSICYILKYIRRSGSRLAVIKRIDKDAKPFEMEVNASRIYEYNEENARLLKEW